MLKVETILFPTDFSKPSTHAFEVAAALARDHGARLVILHVTPPMVVYGEMIPPPRSSPDETLAKIWEVLHNLEAADPKVRGLRVEPRVEEGDPAYGILAVAKEIDAGMIVMGTHGRTGIRRLLMGSIAEEVLRKAPCPVMTVKGPVPVAAEYTEPAAAAAGK